ncbi:DUF3574 domain-containing protein [Lyngbya sp. PCC 8106]|uniref:DUF3574 domain-containing protein n=1 Tax=Lyngbya sp. (strain PCC 8106) TaxID=313612 RepID=UPI0000EA90EB|nr:DUF3574 domain-containing protein [Lyngbya sp. PCC 8106]EAW33998.1 putative lipoprotein [Lyngbya sp. PCC 8106]
MKVRLMWYLGWVLMGSALLFPASQRLEVQAQFIDNPKNSPNNITQTLTKDELYFGLSKQQGQVSEAEWKVFLEEVITPRFQAGLTVIDANGQYLNAAGILTREQTKLVILIHSDTPQEKQFIQEIITQYKQRFNQESVLRVTSSVAVSF